MDLAPLTAVLRSGSFKKLYLIGHSLGGALALSLLGSADKTGRSVLPHDTPPVTVLTFGAPAVFHGAIPTAVNHAAIFKFIHGSDIVPRLLGSPTPLLKRAVQSIGVGATEAVVDSLAGYLHAPGDTIYRQTTRTERNTVEHCWFQRQCTQK